MCVNYIKKEEKKATLHTHIHVFSWLLTHAHTRMHTTREWSRRTGKWANQKRERYLNCFFSYLFVIQAQRQRWRGRRTVSQSDCQFECHVCVPVFVCVWECAICNYSTLTLTEKLPVCVFVCVHMWVDKLISFSYYAVVAVPAHYVTNTCATHSWVPTATSHAMNTHTHTYMHMYSTDIRRVGEVNTNLYFKLKSLWNLFHLHK